MLRSRCRSRLFLSVGTESRSRLFKAAPAVSFRKVKHKSLVLVLSMNSVQFIKINMIQNIMLQLNFFTAQNDKFLCLEPAPPGAPFFVWSRSRCQSRLRDLGLPEQEPVPEPPKKVAAPQRRKILSCFRLNYGVTI